MKTKCLGQAPFSEPHPTNHFLKAMAVRFNFSYLDNFSIYYERGDLTKGMNASVKQDCTHHRYTPELMFYSNLYRQCRQSECWVFTPHWATNTSVDKHSIKCIACFDLHIDCVDKQDTLLIWTTMQILIQRLWITVKFDLNPWFTLN